MNKNANASISNAAFALEEARLNLEEAENNLRLVKMFAPIDGVVLSISRGVGESVSAQNSAAAGIMIFGTGGSGNNFITLCDVTQIYLTASITEGDIVHITNGQPIQVTVDAIGGETFHGVVVNIDHIPTTDMNGITTYNVTCLLHDTSTVIKDGMNAYITFVHLEKPDVLLVPNKAVFMEDEMQHVNVQHADGTHEKRRILGGLSNGVQTEVISGLEAGETVIVGRIN
jgi:multidrug efflux pump subunit AcrA (membrane-fusion protein)